MRMCTARVGICIAIISDNSDTITQIIIKLTETNLSLQNCFRFLVKYVRLISFISFP